jgi:hypothetical protein
VGNTLGVAAVGAVFYGAGDYAAGFREAVLAIIALALAVTVLVQPLRSPRMAAAAAG